jgi:hypothetical protein
MNNPNYRPLPVFHTVKRALELLWLHRFVQLRILMPAFLVLAASGTMVTREMAGLQPDKAAEMLQAIPAKYIATWMGLSSVGTILLMMFSVAWRRFLLLDIAPTTLIFNKPFRRYLILFVAGYFVVIFGALILTQLALTLLGSIVKDQTLLVPLGTIILFAIIAAMVLFVTRYLLLFTAAAIGNTEMKFRVAAAFMKGNVLRFAAAWLIVAIGMNLINNLIATITSIIPGLEPTGVPGSIVVGTLTAATMVITTALTASLAALTYDFLVHGNGPDIVRSHS